MRLINRIWPFKRKPQPPETMDRNVVFRARYISFKELLKVNTDLLDIIADIEEKLRKRHLFGTADVRDLCSRAVMHSMRMILCLNFIADRKYISLLVALDRIDKQIGVLLAPSPAADCPALVISLSDIRQEQVDWVGGKSANLGEVRNNVALPTPEGFAITTKAFRCLIEHNRLQEKIVSQLKHIDPEKPETITHAGAAIQNLIIGADIPDDLYAAIQNAVAQIRRNRPSTTDPLLLAMRSSAIGEDSQWTFAGQYKSKLGVNASQVPAVYLEIVASLYSPRAIAYRLNKGIRDEDMAMGVACLEMIPSVAGGVIYSQNPTDRLSEQIVIEAVWGLGVYAVDGTLTPDTYAVSRSVPHSIIASRISKKTIRLELQADGNARETRVPDDLQSVACLQPDQVVALARWALHLETHYGGAQDIEWALAPDDCLLILQTRPLSVDAPDRPRRERTSAAISGHRVLVDSAITACGGVGCGTAFHVSSDDDLVKVPPGAVIVAKRSSPRFMLAMSRVQAIVAEVGSVTGHMATLAREFEVPTLLNAARAMDRIAHGEEITVDADGGRVYGGRVTELMKQRPVIRSKVPDTPVYQLLRNVADLIVPLHLLDPKAADFTPENCRTLHDIMRVVHELSYKEMFRISDLISYRQGAAVKLRACLPIDLFLIDLGGGLDSVEEKGRRIGMDQVRCLPLKALLAGMLHKDLCRPEPRPVELSGFFAVMREQMLSPPTGGERFGDRSYAIVSDKYLNFSSRVGYHYSILDGYAGRTVSKNYITFSFKGGAADPLRRNRRARAIAGILKTMDFAVEVRSDRVDARLVKYDQAVILDRIERVGRLLQYTRQMDMLMGSEASVEAVERCFIEGRYHLSSEDFCPSK